MFNILVVFFKICLVINFVLLNNLLVLTFGIFYINVNVLNVVFYLFLGSCSKEW